MGRAEVISEMGREEEDKMMKTDILAI